MVSTRSLSFHWLEIRQVRELLENIQNDNFSVLYKRTTLFVRAHSNKIAVYKFEHLFFAISKNFEMRTL